MLDRNKKLLMTTMTLACLVQSTQAGALGAEREEERPRTCLQALGQAAEALGRNLAVLRRHNPEPRDLAVGLLRAGAARLGGPEADRAVTQVARALDGRRPVMDDDGELRPELIEGLRGGAIALGDALGGGPVGQATRVVLDALEGRRTIIDRVRGLVGMGEPTLEERMLRAAVGVANVLNLDEIARDILGRRTLGDQLREGLGLQRREPEELVQRALRAMTARMLGNGAAVDLEVLLRNAAGERTLMDRVRESLGLRRQISEALASRITVAVTARLLGQEAANEVNAELQALAGRRTVVQQMRDFVGLPRLEDPGEVAARVARSIVRRRLGVGAVILAQIIDRQIAHQ